MTRPAKGFAVYIIGATSHDIPKTLRRAIDRDDKDKWQRDMEKQFLKLQSQEIFELVRISNVPKNKRIFPGKWVYDGKDYPPTDERTHKARWVILGNLVEKDDMQYDYCKYAPVAFAATTIRLLFALTAANGWHMRKLDVAIAALNGDLIDEIYMRQPTGFDQDEGLARRLQKLIFGLTPAAQAYC